jgi:hypothetical protein
VSDIDQDELQKAVAAEIQRLTSTGQITLPGSSSLPNRQRAGNYEFDPTTKQILDPNITRHLWRPDNTKQCACGSHKWAHVQAFVGERAIRTAYRPVIDQQTGQLIQMPHQDAYGEYDMQGRPVITSCLIPEDLRLTKEKITHARECNGQRLDALDAEGELEEIDERQAQNVLRMARRGA